MKIKKRTFDFEDEIKVIYGGTNLKDEGVKGLIKTKTKEGYGVFFNKSCYGDNILYGKTKDGEDKYFCGLEMGVYLSEKEMIKTSELIPENNKKIVVRRNVVRWNNNNNLFPSKKIDFYFRKYWLKKDKFNKKDVKLLNTNYKKKNFGIERGYIINSKDIATNKVVIARVGFLLKRNEFFPDKIIFIKTNIKSKIKLDNFFIIGEV